VVPQIRASIRDGNFEYLLSQIEKSAWKAFKSVVIFFFFFFWEIVKPPTTVKLWVNCYSHTKIWGVICPSRYISWTPTWISSLTILVTSVTNTGNVSTKTFLPWKRGTRDRGVQECLLTNVGRRRGMFQMPSTEGNQQSSHFK